MSGNIYEIRKLEIKKLPKWKKIFPAVTGIANYQHEIKKIFTAETEITAYLNFL